MRIPTTYTNAEPLQYFAAYLYRDGISAPEVRAYKTAARALKTAKEHADGGNYAQVREETIYKRTPNAALESSGPMWFSDNGFSNNGGRRAEWEQQYPEYAR